MIGKIVLTMLVAAAKINQSSIVRARLTCAKEWGKFNNTFGVKVVVGPGSCAQPRLAAEIRLDYSPKLQRSNNKQHGAAF